MLCNRSWGVWGWILVLQLDSNWVCIFVCEMLQLSLLHCIFFPCNTWALQNDILLCCFLFTALQILDRIEDVQELIFTKEPDLLRAFIPVQTMHLTVVVAHLGTEEEVKK